MKPSSLRILLVAWTIISDAELNHFSSQAPLSWPRCVVVSAADDAQRDRGDTTAASSSRDEELEAAGPADEAKKTAGENARECAGTCNEPPDGSVHVRSSDGSEYLDEQPGDGAGQIVEQPRSDEAEGSESQASVGGRYYEQEASDGKRHDEEEPPDRRGYVEKAAVSDDGDAVRPTVVEGEDQELLLKPIGKGKACERVIVSRIRDGGVKRAKKMGFNAVGINMPMWSCYGMSVSEAGSGFPRDWMASLSRRNILNVVNEEALLRKAKNRIGIELAWESGEGGEKPYMKCEEGGLYVPVIVTNVEDQEPYRVELSPTKFWSAASSRTGRLYVIPEQEASVTEGDKEDEKSVYIIPMEALEGHVFLPHGYLKGHYSEMPNELNHAREFEVNKLSVDDFLTRGQRVTLVCTAPGEPARIVPTVDAAPRTLQVSRRKDKREGEIRGQTPPKENAAADAAIQEADGNKLSRDRVTPQGLTEQESRTVGKTEETDIAAFRSAELTGATRGLALMFLTEEDGLGFELPLPVLVDRVLFMVKQTQEAAPLHLLAYLTVRPCKRPIHDPIFGQSYEPVQETTVKNRMGGGGEGSGKESGGFFGFFKKQTQKPKDFEAQESREDMSKRCRPKRVLPVELIGTEALQSPTLLNAMLEQIESRLKSDTQCIVAAEPATPKSDSPNRPRLRARLVCPSLEHLFILLREKDASDREYNAFKRTKNRQMIKGAVVGLFGLFLAYRGLRGLTRNPMMARELFAHVIGREHVGNQPYHFFPSERQLYRFVGLRSLGRALQFRRYNEAMGNAGVRAQVGISLWTVSLLALTALLAIRLGRGTRHFVRNRKRVSNIKGELQRRPIIHEEQAPVPELEEAEDECSTVDVTYLSFLY
ncbi:putative transmembrane protein [Toxoplasma gondii MAS]|uniref:Putative transmembrane protein n=2 Tax=Toxoplasma gondii TaxID=5811 RepID=A0A086PP07_TOXGO|nr:putative transmembrane protein [Toxoplasma gondii MAS]PUA89278.1 putative transmembrane protein [Toxoplasma gondii TgCATBr9]